MAFIFKRHNLPCELKHLSNKWKRNQIEISKVVANEIEFLGQFSYIYLRK